jgi:hypothetical protein
MPALVSPKHDMLVKWPYHAPESRDGQDAPSLLSLNGITKRFREFDPPPLHHTID